MSRNYVDENGNLIQIAGKGVGVAEWGTPIGNWLNGHTTSATAITADKDGVLVVRATTHGTGTITIYCNNNILMKTDSGYDFSDEIPIKKGFSYYITSSNVTLNLSTFYPFKENNNLQMVREKYSTEETVIGEYLGKTLYRKVIEIPTINKDALMPITHNIGMGNLVDYGGDFYRTSSNKRFPMPYTDGSNRIAIADIAENQFIIASNYAGTDMVLWIEYTKTTD